MKDHFSLRVRFATQHFCNAARLMRSRDGSKCRMLCNCAKWRRVCWRSPWKPTIGNCSNGFAFERANILTKPVCLIAHSSRSPMRRRRTRARQLQIESIGRSIFLVKHNLFGKPVSTFPDHESRRKIAESAERADREPHSFSAISLKWNVAA
jgi:hypothetical protein